MIKSFIFILALIGMMGGVRCSAQAEVTTWTSASGAQVEARFVGVEGDLVILQPEEGDEVVIRITLLSSADQVRARELATAAGQQVETETEDDSEGGLPALTEGPGRGHHAYYSHAHFDAWVARNGRLYIHPKHNGQRVGRSFYIRPRVIENVGGNPTARFIGFVDSGQPAQQPQTVSFTAQAHRRDTDLTYRVEYTFEQNRICVATEIVEPRRSERSFSAWSDVRVGPIENIPAAMPQAERVKLLEPHTLRWRTANDRRWRENNFYDAKSLRGRVDDAEITGPWGPRKWVYRGDNRREGNRTIIWHYSGRPLNDGIAFIQAAELGHRAGTACITIE